MRSLRGLREGSFSSGVEPSVMQQRLLGRTGLSVSVMGLGCGGHSRLGISQGKGDDNAVAIVRRAIDLGVNFIDTAEAYGTETIVGRALEEGGDRASAVISTKVSPRTSGALRSGEQFREAVHAGLRRLRTEYVDILHIHGVHESDYDYCRSELLPVLSALRDEGKIRFPGITEAFGHDPTHAMLHRAILDDDWDVMMVGFSLINQSARERILPATQAKGIGVLDMFAVRRALGDRDGLLTLMRDMVEKGQLPADRLPAGSDPLAFLEGAGDTLPDIAYRFCRDEPGLDLVLSGTGSLDHLQANTVSLEGPPLPANVTERLHALFAGVDSVSGN